MPLYVKILIQLILLIFTALLTISETSVISASESVLQRKNDKRASRLMSLRKHPKKYLNSIRSALTAAKIASGTFAAVCFSGYLTAAFNTSGINETLLTLLSAVIIIAMASLITLIFGEFIPKQAAIKNTDKTALGISLFASAISGFFLPLSTCVSVVSGGILRIFGIKSIEHDTNITEENIKMMIDAGSEKGTIETEEKELIENVFDFNDLTADDVATHRKSITLLWKNENPEEWEKTIYASSHTYFPICENKIDNVIGVLNAKKYFRLKDRSAESIMKNAVNAPYFVPESVKANLLFKSMKQKRCYFSIIIDEYGGMSGIVTLTDLLQCIVGDIYEESDEEKPPEIEPLDSKIWMIRGSAPIEDVEKALDISLDGDFDTFAGYVLTMVDSIPDDGETATFENELMKVKITSVKEHRIEKTMVQLKDPDTEESE